MGLDVGSAVGSVRLEYGSVNRAVAAIQRSLGKLSSDSKANFDKAGQAAESGLGKVNKSAGSAEDALKKLSGRLDKINPAVFLGIGAAVAAGAGLAVKAAFDINSTLETTQLQFETLMGDADKAREHVASLFEFAKRTPFETGPIIEASRMLQTFGGDALNTEDNLTLIGDASAAVSAPIEELGFWVGSLYSNLQGGQPFGEAAMRLQELAVLSPAARQEMEKLQKSGASAEEVFAVFEGSLGRFSGAMEKQAATWGGMWSTAVDSVKLALGEGLRPLFDGAKEGLAGVIEIFNSPEFAAGVQKFATQLGNALKVVMPLAVKYGPLLLTVLTGIVAALGALSISLKVSAGIAAVKAAFVGLTGASAAAGAASTGALAGTLAALTPLLPVIALVAGAVALLAVAWAKDWGGIRGKTADAVAYVKGVVGQGVAALRAVWEEHGEGIVRAVSHLWAAIQSYFATGFAIIGKVFQAFGALLRGDWEEVGRYLREAAQKMIDGVRDIFQHLGEAIGPALEAAGRRIVEWWNNIDWEGMAEQALRSIGRGLALGTPAGAFEAGQRHREEFQRGWDEADAAAEPWALWAAGEAEKQAAEAVQRVAQEAASADRVLAQHAETYEYVADSAGDAKRELSRTAVQMALSGDHAGKAADGTGKLSGAVDKLTTIVGNNKTKLDEAKAAAEAYVAAFAAIQGDYTTELPGADKPFVTPEQTVTITTGGLSEADADLLAQYREEAEKLQQEISDITNGIGTFGVEQEKLNVQLSGAQGELAHYQALMAPLEGVTGDVSTAHRGLSVNLDAVHQGIYDELVQMGAGPEVITAFGVATGIMSEAQATAALQAAAVKVKIEELATRMAEGLPIETALADLDSFIQKIETGVTPAAETMATDVPARVTEMKDAMSEGALAAGEAVPVGLSEGINTRLEEATTAAGDAADDVVDKVKSVFGVESPSTVFAEIGGELMAGLKEGVEDGSVQVIRLVEDTADEVLAAWDDAIDRMYYIGEALILGIIDGVEGSRGLLIAKMREIAYQAYVEMMEELGINSPSKVFMETGRSIIEGIVVGLDEQERRLTDKMGDVAGGLGDTAESFGISVGNALIGGIAAGIERQRQDLLDQLDELEDDMVEERDRILRQLAELEQIGRLEGFAGAANSLLGGAFNFFGLQADALAGQIEAAQGSLEGAISGLAPFAGSATIENLLNMSAEQQALALRGMRNQYEFTSNPEAMRRLEAALQMATDRNALEQEYIRQQEELLALQEAQQKLDFLSYQVDLIKLITDNGLDASILDGLELGLDANMTDIIAAMTAAVQQLIAATEDELDIASPSGVFRDIGQNVMDGLARGIAAADDPQAALQAQIDSLSKTFDPAASPFAALQDQMGQLIGGRLMDGLEAGIAGATGPQDALQDQLDGLGKLFDPAQSPFGALQGLMSEFFDLAGRPELNLTGGEYQLSQALQGHLSPSGAAAETLPPPQQNVYIFGGYNPQVERAAAADPIRDFFFRGL